MANETQPRVVKVDKSSLIDLKNASDEALKVYLETKAGYKQSHKHTDTKLALGYTSCIIAAAGSYYGYIHPFELPETKFWTAIAVGLYYLFNVLMMAYSYFVEKNIIFVGSKTTPNGKHTISVGSSIKHCNPYYDLDIHMNFSGSSGAVKAKKIVHQEFSTAFGSWYDEDGVLAQDQFEADLAKFFANTEAVHLE
ncbi:hypothetical protein BGZ76_002993 [Entomortierella beljakovae]|nr:hypothetical protein BGZ76_002993 [Entomortierella beljakovae]